LIYFFLKFAPYVSLPKTEQENAGISSDLIRLNLVIEVKEDLTSIKKNLKKQQNRI
jgi:O-acetylhomoserine/O-acetylserine sulfhydrylase-like pyridoxal-dependent enzyme